MILKVSTREKLDAPSVGMTVVVQFPPAKGGVQGLGALRTDFIGVDVINTFTNDGNSPQMPNDSNTRGITNTQMFVAGPQGRLLDALRPAGIRGRSGRLPVGQRARLLPDQRHRHDRDAPPATSTHYSYDATTAGTYHRDEGGIEDHDDRGIVGCPIASGGTSGPGANTATSSGSGGPSPTVEALTLALPMMTVKYRFEAERSTIPP